MNKDRGTMKWNSLMLPEHIQLLRNWKKKSSTAYKDKHTLTLTIYKNNCFSKITGIIKASDNQKRQLLIKSDATINLIPFDAIQSADSHD